MCKSKCVCERERFLYALKRLVPWSKLLAIKDKRDVAWALLFHDVVYIYMYILPDVSMICKFRMVVREMGSSALATFPQALNYVPSRTVHCQVHTEKNPPERWLLGTEKWH